MKSSRPMESTHHVRWFEDTGLSDLPAVGGKNAALGELHRVLGDLGLPSLDGFAVTTDAFRETLGAGGWEEVRRLLAGMDKRDMDALSASRSGRIRWRSCIPSASGTPTRSGSCNA